MSAVRGHEIVQKLPCGHDPIWDRPGGCLKCRAFAEGVSVQPVNVPRGLSSLEAIGLVKKHGLRVTFGPEVVVERHPGDPKFFDWLEIARAPSFLDAVMQARDRMGLRA